MHDLKNVGTQRQLGTIGMKEDDLALRLLALILKQMGHQPVMGISTAS